MEALNESGAFKGIFERSEGRVGDEEGLEPSVGVLSGEAPPDAIMIEENGHKFLVDLRRGQKTGFFLDQRDNRVFLSSVAQDRTVLNCFSFSGAFSVYAFAGRAKEVVSLDSSMAALELAEKNLELNGFAGAPSELLKGDAFAYLKEIDRKFDLIVLDPPSLAHKRTDLDAVHGDGAHAAGPAHRHRPALHHPVHRGHGREELEAAARGGARRHPDRADRDDAGGLGLVVPWSPHMDAWSAVPTPVEYVKGRTPLELQGALVIRTSSAAPATAWPAVAASAGRRSTGWRRS